MTKTQIAARCLLTGLVVYAVIVLPRPLTELPYHFTADNVPLGVFLLVLCAALLVAAGLYVAALAGRLVPEPAADERPLAPERQKRLLAQALLLTMVSLGLMLLPKSVPTIAATLKLPWTLRLIINEAIVDHRLPAQWVKHLYEFVRMLLVLYLLCGAPRLVRWEIARAETSRSKRTNENGRLGNG